MARTALNHVQKGKTSALSSAPATRPAPCRLPRLAAAFPAARRSSATKKSTTYRGLHGMTGKMLSAPVSFFHMKNHLTHSIGGCYNTMKRPWHHLCCCSSHYDTDANNLDRSCGWRRRHDAGLAVDRADRADRVPGGALCRGDILADIFFCSLVHQDVTDKPIIRGHHHQQLNAGQYSFYSKPPESTFTVQFNTPQMAPTAELHRQPGTDNILSKHGLFF